jgi:anti-anti-sigma factor
MRHEETSMPQYKLEGSVLTVTGPLDAESDQEFQERCRRLMDCEGDVLTLDMREVHSITSSCIGVLSVIWVDTLTQDRQLEVIVSDKVRRALTIAGFHRVFALKDAV